MGSDVRIRFRDLSVPSDERQSILSLLDSILAEGELILGVEVERFESEMAAACGTAHAVGVSNGTAALYLSLRGLGVGPGDEVVTSPMSWVATANAILALGAVPVYADVTDDYLVDPDAIEAAISPRTVAILPVHLYGRLADMPLIMKIAQRADVKVVEDAAQAFGGIRSGRPAGSFGDAGAFSLNPMKPLAALGEAGAVVTNDPRLAEKLRTLRYLGTENREVCVDPSLNYKIDTIQAAVLRLRMANVERVVSQRNKVADYYSAHLSDLVVVPTAVADGLSAVFDYTIWTVERDSLESHLLACGIEVKVRSRSLLCDQPGYARHPEADVPNARRLVDGILNLPIHEKLGQSDIDYVISSVRSFFGSRAKP